MRFNPLAMMGNNPIAKAMNLMQNGGDPSALVQEMIQNHPQREQIQRIISGKNDKQIMQTAENMCRERGTSVDEVLARVGITR